MGRREAGEVVKPVPAGRGVAPDPADTPHLTTFVQLTGGHCAILERPEQVNRRLRALAESVIPRERAS